MAEAAKEYRVQLPIFEGPLDLLLHLVKVNEMEITDVSLAGLTHQYLDYLEQIREMDLDVAGDFLVVAATLMQIKARYLLPGDEDEDLEDDEEMDQLLGARELMRQLIEYRSYKEIVAELKRLEDESAKVFYRSRLPGFLEAETKSDAPEGDLKLLFEAMVDVLRYIERRDPHTALFEEYRTEDKIEYLQARLRESASLDLVEEFERCLNKTEIIVTFLALLELVRLRRIRVTQDEEGGAVRITARVDGETDAPLAMAETTNHDEERTSNDPESEPGAGD